ncbi:MAG: McrC family protein [Solobacterium sp.]|nr:McrC family protein [Solobacterium sp.]
MMERIVLKEFDELYIKNIRDVSKGYITSDDAIALQSIIMDQQPVFRWGYKKLIAQHWIGTITLKDLNIEILPKLYGQVSADELRLILMRMIFISHQSPSVREVPGMAQLTNNSLIEMLISTFLNACDRYTKEGLQNSYKKINSNIVGVKGRILFNKQINSNYLDPCKFWCHYSKFDADNNINRFIKLCLRQMLLVSNDDQNLKRIRSLLPIFDDVSLISKDQALSCTITFNSVNHKAEESYDYGKLFLSNVYSTLSAGNTKISMMLFDMNSLFELFIYKTAKTIYRGNVTYQLRGNYLIERNFDHKKFIGLRPDIVIKKNSGMLDIIDTKWKIPTNFAKESDAYQMNAYSSGIDNVDRIFLIYPYTQNSDMINDFSFIDHDDGNRPLLIRTIDLRDVLNWNVFIAKFKLLFN